MHGRDETHSGLLSTAPSVTHSISCSPSKTCFIPSLGSGSSAFDGLPVRRHRARSSRPKSIPARSHSSAYE
eukprot:2810150-Rhodomonas_salina.3